MNPTPTPISIWTPQEQDHQWIYQRPEPGPYGDHYAARPSFSLKAQAGAQRICFFGESAAAGYLYAPHLTPALMLEHQLNAAIGQQTYEVIDLARTNERLDSLLETVEQAMQLEPQALVIYVGNNWNLLESPELSGLVPNRDQRQEFGKLLAEGLEHVLHVAAQRVLGKAMTCFTKIAELCKTFKTYVVLVIPEVNLADWESHQPPPYLPEARLIEWYETFLEAQTALEEKRYVDLRKKAMHLLSLDEGTTPTPFRLLVHAWLGEGKKENAYEAARAEIDATHYASLCFLDAPRANSLAQNLLMRLAHQHAFELVDMRTLFMALDPDHLPGRRFFLDYCHLTQEGMQVTCAAIATKLLPIEYHQGDWRKIYEAHKGPAVANAIHALAYLGAAIHTAHRENAVTDNSERISYWLKLALTADPEVLNSIQDLVHIRVSRAQAPMVSNTQKPGPSLSQQHGLRYDHLDAKLLRAITSLDVNALDNCLDCVLVNSLAIRRDPDDLAEPYFLWDPLQRFFPEVMPFQDLPCPAHLRAAWPFTSIALVSDGQNDIELEITARIPNALGHERHNVVICLEDHVVANLNFSRNWSKQKLTLNKARVPNGLNRLTLCWPIAAAAVREFQTKIKERLHQGHETPLHPIFGELANLKAKTCTPSKDKPFYALTDER